jgi:hypothetical protein
MARPFEPVSGRNSPTARVAGTKVRSDELQPAGAISEKYSVSPIQSGPSNK